MAGSGTIQNRTDLVALARDRYSHPKHKQVHLSKEDLTKLRDELETSGKSTKKIDDLLKNYDTIDINGDGISTDEYQTYTKAGLPSGFRSLPSISLMKDDLQSIREKMTKDGSSTEVLDKIIQNFDSVDLDGDGVLSGEELKNFAIQNSLTLPSELLRTSKKQKDNLPSRHQQKNNRETAKELLSALESRRSTAQNLVDYLHDQYNADGSKVGSNNPLSVLPGVKA